MIAMLLLCLTVTISTTNHPKAYQAISDKEGCGSLITMRAPPSDGSKRETLRLPSAFAISSPPIMRPVSLMIFPYWSKDSAKVPHQLRYG